MSAGEYYNHTTFPAQGSAGSSSLMRAELEAIETGFSKLPDLAGNGSELVRINAAGTAMETVVADLNQLTGVVQQSKSADYTAVLGDAGKHIYHPVSDTNNRTFTIPANASVAYEVGTTLTFINEVNTVTIAITSDTMVMAGTGSTGSRTLAAYGMATAIKVTSTRWVISGTGLS